MMRKVTENEIYDLKGERVNNATFLKHVPYSKIPLLCHINHVDTRLREDKENKYWRVQGYINLSDFADMKESGIQFDAYVGIASDCLELWSLIIKYVE